MIDLEECPICGKQPERHVCKRNLDEDSYYVVYECRQEDHTVSGKGDSDLEAIDAWNTRHEPICHMEQSGAGEDVACENCGAYNIAPFRDSEGHLVIPTYCPSCGSKVVDK